VAVAGADAGHGDQTRHVGGSHRRDHVARAAGKNRNRGTFRTDTDAGHHRILTDHSAVHRCLVGDIALHEAQVVIRQRNRGGAAGHARHKMTAGERRFHRFKADAARSHHGEKHVLRELR
jgi:hypothetical protein